MCFPGGYNVKLYISRGRLAWWLLTFLCFVGIFICYWYHAHLLLNLNKCYPCYGAVNTGVSIMVNEAQEK